jgi:hypothetical protein
MTMRYEEFASSMMADYELYLYALMGRYQAIRAPGVEVTPQVVRLLEVDAYRLSKTFSQIASETIKGYANPMIAASSEEFVDSLAQRKKEVEVLIQSIVIENVRQIIHMTKTGFGGYISMLKDASGGMGLLVQQKIGTVEFKVTDTSGRKWEAKRLMRVIARDYAYQSWLDWQASTYLDADYDIMKAKNDFLFSLKGTEGYPSFEEVRGLIFHPNSNSTMVPHVST